MPILRFSCIKDRLYVPRDVGLFVDADYAETTGCGRVHGLIPPALCPEGGALDRHLSAQLDALDPGEPVLLMANGFDYSPRAPLGGSPEARLRSDNPHAKLFHFEDRDEAGEIAHHSLGWPLHLGFEPADDGAGGLAIAYGWETNAGHHAVMYDDGKLAAWGLLSVLDVIARRRPEARVDMIGHSLGTHLILHALRKAAQKHPNLLARVRRVFLLAGSEFVNEAQTTYAALEARDFDESIDIVNLTSEHDDVVHAVSGIATFGPDGAKDMIGHFGLARKDGPPPRGWIDLELSGPALREWVQDRHGLAIRGDNPDGTLDHWIHYTHRDNMRWVKALLRAGDGTRLIDALRADGVPEGVTPSRGDIDWSARFADLDRAQGGMGPL